MREIHGVTRTIATGDVAAADASPFYHPTTFEISSGWVHGRVPAPAEPSRPASSARAALDLRVLHSLLQPPCYVAFSGGRDSSAVLAVATQQARQHGLPDPVPVTEVYPDVPEADESEWQQLVIDHLQLTEWHRIVLTTENDLLSEVARASLGRRGLIWPASLHLKDVFLGSLGGGSLLTGEGGDEVLGRRRGAQVSRLWRPVRRPTVSGLRSAAATIAPASVRASRLPRWLEAQDIVPWLRPEARARHHRLMAVDLASEPMTTAASLRWLLTRRSAVVMARNHAAVAREHGVEITDPLLSPDFVYALAREAGTWGFASRSSAMRYLFADVLPEAVISRRSKAYFNRAFLGADAQDFAVGWNGSGVDHDLVDSERLRAEWLSDFPSAISMMLLHSAWLGSSTHTGSQEAR
jgi:asparagine synthetase B (glutamine-hydrolysing)